VLEEELEDDEDDDELLDELEDEELLELDELLDELDEDDDEDDGRANVVPLLRSTSTKPSPAMAGFEHIPTQKSRCVPATALVFA
jgi:hypothetical protein